MGDKQNEGKFLVAAHVGDAGRVRALLSDKKVDVDTQWTLEQAAAAKGDRSERVAGDTALHFAVRSENHEVVETLLKHGSRINITNKIGQSALNVAVKENEALTQYRKWSADYGGSTSSLDNIIDMLTLHLVKQRLAFMRAMNNYNLDLEVLNKIGEMHQSLHK